MTENEFINELQSALENEIPLNEINNNLKYYRDYLNNQSKIRSMEEITRELGDPRLIARTIIDTYQINHGGSKHYSNEAYQERYTTTEEGYRTYNDKKSNNREFRENENQMKTYKIPRWLGIVIVISILIIILSVLSWLGGLILRIFFRFAIPIILLTIGISVLRNRTRR